jgi:hypothetical protein
VTRLERIPITKRSDEAQAVLTEHHDCYSGMTFGVRRVNLMRGE